MSLLVATPAGKASEVTALVTGASRGIGQAIAEEIGAFCGRTVLVGRSQERLDAVAARLVPVTRSAWALAADLSRPDEIERLAAFVEERSGRLDFLVHAAGVFESGTLDREAGEALMAVNYHAPVALTRRLLPLLKAAKGQVVFINSTQALQAGRGVGDYAASKFALRAFADSLRAEVNGDGVRVLTVYTGSTATDMQKRIHVDAGRDYRPERLMQPGDVAAMVAAALRLPRTAEATEITVRPMQPPLHPR
jgi:short-subunit dehydrogenase